MYTDLKRSGDRFTGLCPFPDHNEKTPSFSVSESKQMYYCFGCKKAGNIYNFLQAMRGLSFPETVEYLARKSGIPIPEGSIYKKSESDEKRLKKQNMLKLNTFSSEFFYSYLRSLSANDQRVQYLARRGLSPEIIKTFKVGISPDSWDNLTNELTKKKAPLDLASQLGLLKKKDKGGYYDIFRNRLMFPIFSHIGDCIGFGGRTLGDDKAKYINSPESDIFHKGKIFYGLNETAKHIRTSDQAIVVEGYMDFMALYSVGIKNVVAVLGTALTPYHAKLLKRFTQNILMLFDGDASGKAAAERSLPILLAESLYPKVVNIPDNLDPDDYIKKEGAEGFKKLLNSSQDLFLSVFQEHLKNYTGQPSEKVQILNKIAPILNSVAENSLKKLYIEEIADTLRQKPSWVVGFLKPQATRSVAGMRSQKKLTQEAQKSVIEDRDLFNLSRASKAELYLVNLALMKEVYMKKLLEAEVSEQFADRDLRAFVDKLLTQYRQKPNDFDKLTALLANIVEPSGVITKYMDRSWSQMDESSLEKFFNDCLKKVQERHLKSKQQSLKEKMRSSGPENRQQHLEQFMNIQKHRQALNNNNKSN